MAVNDVTDRGTAVWWERVARRERGSVTVTPSLTEVHHVGTVNSC